MLLAERVQTFEDTRTYTGVLAWWTQPCGELEVEQQ